MLNQSFCNRLKSALACIGKGGFAILVSLIYLRPWMNEGLDNCFLAILCSKGQRRSFVRLAGVGGNLPIDAPAQVLLIPLG
jgi:hypothetical protein